MLVTREEAEWNARYADFLGHEFHIGQSFDARVPYALAGGQQLQYTVRTTFAAWVPCGRVQCVRIEQVFSSDVDALTHMAAEATRQRQAPKGTTQSAPAGATPSAPSLQASTGGLSGAQLIGRLSRVTEPLSMRIHSEHMQRTVTLTLPMAGQAAAATVQTESREYAYVYE